MTKILVVDDDDLIRTMMCSILTKASFEVEQASNGEEAVQKAAQIFPDLVITDILMPDKEGIETIMELKALRSDIKIIAMSGGGNSSNMTFLEMARKVGARHVLQKPFKPGEMLEAVQAVLALGSP